MNSIGAACPKILFSGRFQEIAVEVPDAGPIGRDERELGIRVTGVRFDGQRDDERVEFDEGFHLPEAPHLPDDEEIARWSIGAGADPPARRRWAGRASGVADRRPSHRGRSASSPARRSSRPRSARPRPGSRSTSTLPCSTSSTTSVPTSTATGSAATAASSNATSASTRNRPRCSRGAAARCCSARVYLDDVGMFDEELFLYYEDTDLAWRGRLRGWRYQYVPTSVIRHRHAQSSGAWSPTFRFYTERNRMLVLAKNAPARLALRAILGAIKRLVVTFLRQVVLRPFVLRLPGARRSGPPMACRAQLRRQAAGDDAGPPIGSPVGGPWLPVVVDGHEVTVAPTPSRFGHQIRPHSPVTR